MNQQPRYQYVLFDWDGCLAQTLDTWIEAVKETCALFNSFPTHQQMMKALGSWRGDLIGINKSQEREFNDLLLSNASCRLGNVKLFDNAKTLLAQLQNAGCKLAVVSSSPTEHLEAGLISNGIYQYFDAVIAAGDVTNYKPHPESIELAISKLNGQKDSCIMIGDSEKDLGAGRAADIHTMLIHHKENELVHDFDYLLTFNPTHITRSFTEAASILFGNQLLNKNSASSASTN